MSNAAEELDDYARSLEHIALELPRHLAAMVLTVAAARIAAETPAPQRAVVEACGERGWTKTLDEYRKQEAKH